MRATRRLASTILSVGLAAGLARGDDGDEPARVAQAPAPSNRPQAPATRPPTPTPATPDLPGAPARTGPPQAPGTTPTTPTTPARPTTPATGTGTGATPGAGNQPQASSNTNADASSNSSSVNDLSSVAGQTTNAPPIFTGDQPPFGFRTVGAIPRPGAPPSPHPAVPPSPPSPSPGRNRASAVVPWIRGFKIAENQSPRPQDRVFFSFNYYDNLNYAVNARLGSPLKDLQVYRELFGFEKTFLDGNASIGLRMPLNSITGTSSLAGFGGGSTAINNLSAFTKFILAEDKSTGSLISGGVAVTSPTGPAQFAGFNRGNSVGFHDAQIQPYLGYIWRRDKFYIQGFEAIDIPTDRNDVTMLYTDVGVGYYAYTAADKRAWLRAVVPTLEVHVNNPLNHRGAVRFNDPAGTADVVDLTFAANFLLGDRSNLTFAFVEPTTGPRPFQMEWAVLYNVYFGKSVARNRSTPPIAGQ